MLNALLYTFILYHILFLLICDAFMCVHCIVFYSSATEALINNNNNNNVAYVIQFWRVGQRCSTRSRRNTGASARTRSELGIYFEFLFAHYISNIFPCFFC